MRNEQAYISLPSYKRFRRTWKRLKMGQSLHFAAGCFLVRQRRSMAQAARLAPAPHAFRWVTRPASSLWPAGGAPVRIPPVGPGGGERFAVADTKRRSAKIPAIPVVPPLHFVTVCRVTARRSSPGLPCCRILSDPKICQIGGGGGLAFGRIMVIIRSQLLRCDHIYDEAKRMGG